MGRDIAWILREGRANDESPGKDKRARPPAEPKAKLERIWELVTVADANSGIGPRLLKLEPSDQNFD